MQFVIILVCVCVCVCVCYLVHLHYNIDLLDTSMDLTFLDKQKRKNIPSS